MVDTACILRIFMHRNHLKEIVTLYVVKLHDAVPHARSHFAKRI